MANHGFQDLGIVVAALEGQDDAFFDGKGRISDEEGIIDLLCAADAVAIRTGAIRGIEKPCSGQAKAKEKTCSPSATPPFAPEDVPPCTARTSSESPMSWTSTRPSASFVANSTASAMRLVAERFSTTLSTTTSMKCLIFLFRVSGSFSRRIISPSMRTRVKPSFFRSSKSFVNSPFFPDTMGAKMMARAPSSSAKPRISSVT